jgi:hypothetical protein
MLKQVLFEPASSTSTWRYTYRLVAPNMEGWESDVDLVVLGMSPDAVTFDDYGLRSRTFPPASNDSTAPWFQASSDDGSGVVTLLDPSTVDIIVPWNTIRWIGPGMINVGLQYRNKLTDERSTLLTGRLPLMDGVI